MMAMSFAAIAAIPGIEKLVYPFLIVYGVSYFFTEFGPNATTFVYPAELFPVEGRTTGHGIASAAGKVGGFIGVFLFPILLSAGGLFAAESCAAAVSVLGILVTVFMLPETKGLEELSAEEADARALGQRWRHEGDCRHRCQRHSPIASPSAAPIESDRTRRRSKWRRHCRSQRHDRYRRTERERPRADGARAGRAAADRAPAGRRR